MKQLKEFYKKLRQLGFKRTTKKFSYGVLIYAREFPEHGSRVIVQFWAEPSFHRVTHFHQGITSPYGLCDSMPSIFETVEGMVRAIEFEKTRFEKRVSANTAMTFD